MKIGISATNAAFYTKENLLKNRLNPIVFIQIKKQDFI